MNYISMEIQGRPGMHTRMHYEYPDRCLMELWSNIFEAMNISKLSGHSYVHARPSKTNKMTPTFVQEYAKSFADLFSHSQSAQKNLHSVTGA